MEKHPKSKGWWQTIPGILTATAGIITAVTGLIVAMHQAGFLYRKETPQISSVTKLPGVTASKESTPTGASEEQQPRYSPSKTASVSGTYNGSAFNQTYGRSGKLRLVINSDSSGKVTGTINITGALVGSGPLEGHTDGYSIGFTSVERSTLACLLRGKV